MRQCSASITISYDSDRSERRPRMATWTPAPARPGPVGPLRRVLPGSREKPRAQPEVGDDDDRQVANVRQQLQQRRRIAVAEEAVHDVADRTVLRQESS